jgi:hypothetical protein
MGEDIDGWPKQAFWVLMLALASETCRHELFELSALSTNHQPQPF